MGASVWMMPPSLTPCARLLLAHVLGHEVATLDQGAVTVGDHADDPALLASVLAGDDQDLVVLANAIHHKTSGASDTIFMNRLSRSSRATGPKMRVPRGDPSSRTITHALSSNLM